MALRGSVHAFVAVRTAVAICGAISVPANSLRLTWLATCVDRR
jgi:hypothetical protein